MANLYAAADWLISTSSYEGFNLPLLESISLGTPVIASDLPVHREVASDAGVYFSDDIDDLAATITTVTKSTTLRNKLAHNTYQIAEGYCWQQAARDVLALLETAAVQ